MSLGFGVIINMLGGNEDSTKIIQKNIGKTITSVNVLGNELTFKFEDNSTMTLFDDGQSCCEHRYMSTDDDLSYYSGAVFNLARVADGPTVTSEYDDAHEQQFLIIETTKGNFTVVNHNEHNGYYGGFYLAAKG